MNWGKGIAIFLVLFISFILSMVFKMVSTSTDLEVENYYEASLIHEAKIQAIRNANSFKDKITVNNDGEKIHILFPNEVVLNDVEEGTIHFYRPENGKLDKKFPFIKTNKQELVIPLQSIEKGNYKLFLSWKTSEKDFFVEIDDVVI